MPIRRIPLVKRIQGDAVASLQYRVRAMVEREREIERRCGRAQAGKRVLQSGKPDTTMLADICGKIDDQDRRR